MPVRRAVAYLPAALWAAVLLQVGGSTDLPPVPAFPHSDKLLHFGAWGVLGALLGFGWQAAGRRPAWGWLLAGALLLGALDEFQQTLISERRAEVADWVADALGAATGFLLAVRLVRQRERRNHERPYSDSIS